MQLAAQGMRDVGDGSEKIANPTEAAELRARGKRVLVLSLALAGTATLLAVLAVAL